MRVSIASPRYRTVVSIEYMATPTRRAPRTAARLFAERGFHGTSMGDIAEAMGVQKGSLYSLTGSKQELLVRDDARRGDGVPRGARRDAGRRAGRRAHPAGAARRTFASSPSSSTSRPSSPASGATSRASTARRSWRSGAGTRSAGARSSARGSSAASCASTSTSARPSLLVLSAANWAYTWLDAGADTEELADRFTAILLDGVRGYATH